MVQTIYSAQTMLDLIVDDIYEEGNSNRMNPGGISFKKLHQVKIFPNPASSYINYEVRLSEQEEGMVTVFNHTGISLIKFKVEQGFNSLQFKTESLATGIYFISLISNKNFSSYEKFIVAK